MKTVKYILFVSTFIFLTNCTENSGDNLISGTVTGGSELIISELSPGEIVGKDTLSVSSGTFSWGPESAIENTTMYLLEFSEGGKIPLILTPGDQVEITIENTGENPLYTIEGSNESKRLNRLREIGIENSAFLDSLDHLVKTTPDGAEKRALRPRLDAAFQERIIKVKKQLRSFIEEDTTSLTNLFVLSQKLGQYSIISPEEDLGYLISIDNGLQSKHDKNPHAIQYHNDMQNIMESVERAEQVELAKQNIVVGGKAPEIELNTPDGDVLALSSLRGKVVLIDFWAAWCGPCRANHPHLVKVYNEYKDKGFTIFSVSLDGTPQQRNAAQDWAGAIQQDGLPWTNHVSDLRGWNSEVITKYGFNAIPFSILIDAEGTIISVNPRGKQLEEALAMVLR